MRRFVLLFFAVLIGLAGYFWYTGDIRTWVASAKDAVFPPPAGNGNLTPAVGQVDDAAIRPATAALTYRAALSTLSDPKSHTPQERVEAWDSITKAFLAREPGARDREVLTALQDFVSTYVLSPRMPDDPRIAIRHNVSPGDSLAAIAKKNGTTTEAIQRINNLSGDVIRPGLSLKVLNQPIAVFVDKSDFLLWVTYGGRLLAVMPCGIGRENRTPPGTFRITERIKDPVWYPPDGPSIPPGDPENLLGSRWLGFEDKPPDFTGLGIHEATDVTDIGKESSNGCIRLEKENVELLFDLVPNKTPVTISE